MQFKMNKREALIAELVGAQEFERGFCMSIKEIQRRAAQALMDLDKLEDPPIHPSQVQDLDTKV